MKTDLVQKLQLKQELTVSQTMIQSLQILEMQAFDLEKWIDNQIEVNPLLNWKSNYVPLYEIDRESFVQQEDPLDDLRFQLATSSANQAIGIYLLECLDEHGYLYETIEQLANELSVSKQEVRKTLTIIQSFEPKGIAHDSLENCLLAQISKDNPNYRLLKKAIQHLQLFADGYFEEAKQLLGCSEETMQELFQTIQSLNPYPLINQKKDAMVLFPDVTITLEDETLSFSLYRFEENFEVDQSLQFDDPQAKAYLHQKRKEANHVFKVCEKRSQTLFEIVSFLTAYQKSYFLEGKLKPLTLKQVADATGFAESTIHRALKHKAFLFQNNLLPFQILFPNALNDISSTTYKKRIRELIDSEDQKHPYSDAEIKDLLAKENLNISRRTIAKYRNEMRILSSSKRRLLKKD